MKLFTKISIICALFVATATLAHSQGYPAPQLVTKGPLTTPRTPVLSNLADTVNNTGTGKLQIQINGFQNDVSLQCNLTNISGTTGGTVTLWGSDDGVNWQQIPSIIQTTGVIGLDSWSPSSSSLTHIFQLGRHYCQVYQIRYVGASTMSVAMSGLGIWRRQP